MACPPAVMGQEDRFLAALSAVRKARREGDTLLLLDESGRVLMRLTLISRQSAQGSVRAEAVTLISDRPSVTIGAAKIFTEER